ncbi:hypothetical protein CAPTEDRAFT_159540 [Capitella teleta]|uniref:Ubiquitin carboxyl-terminal hydrolase n=1 Tax=Capitella teleta TaxID=283909 RepID=R7T500_CAPTE|nr:hypothetical protein CAPTEDRAFT_159540 [Capitella teleta]|eukprot:ELT88016.1 hypothetical protein CAPTEDRAFT_159540 [Capitella teleta]
MPVFKVHIKWGKEKFQNVECNTDEPPILFKAQIFALSGVQPDRQKVMVKGVVIKDDDWGSAKIKDGIMMMMMGTAEALPQEPAGKTVFVEDMSEQQLASALELPSGLTNLGNTCYMNATLQCLRSIPELKESLSKFSSHGPSSGLSVEDSITVSIGDLFRKMDATSAAQPPFIMLSVLHSSFPQFAEKTEQGTFQQQDANECWTQLVRCMQKKLPALKSSEDSAQASSASSSQGFIDQYMGGQFSNTMKCIESEDEEPTHSTEVFYQLSCFIEKEVKYLATGLKSRLEEHIEKNSPVLNRNAQYTKTSRISRLPSYLPIQMVRFYYKEKEQVNAKILKDIKFPMQLDVFDLCTEELQQRLIPARSQFKEIEDLRVEQMEQVKAKGDQTKGKNAEKDAVTFKQPFSFPDDPGSSNSGYYELQAVLTHKGRSSSSGHYVAWVRKTGDDWLMFDDDEVTPMQSEDILRLSGGGDWHCAYILLYGPRVLELREGEVLGKKSSEEKMETSEKSGGESKMETS